MPADINAAQATRNEVIAALRQASAATGSDFHYLLSTAMRESSLRPEAKSSSSSAAGLFQFVQQTWLGMIKQYGPRFGLGSYADAISKSAEGHYTVGDAADRNAILAMRSDPKISALMAGEYAQATSSEMQSLLGRPVTSGELYAAHFLGPGAACRLIELSKNQPGANAAQCFPVAADANRHVFFHADGSAKTVREVYDWTRHLPAVHVGAAQGVAAVPPIAQKGFLTAALAPAASASDLLPPTSGTGQLAALGLFRDASAPASGTTLPQTPFLLTPGVVSLLSNLDPATALSRPKDGETS